MKTFMLKFHRSARFGELGLGEESVSPILHSDTLFNAICNAWVALFGVDELESLLDDFKSGDPPFLVSSAFPYTCVDSKFFLFLPFPQPFLKRKLEPLQWKKLKKIKFIEFDILKDGKIKWTNFVDESVFTIKDGFLIRKEHEEELRGSLPIFRSERTIRNRLDRVTKASMLFYLMETFFKENSGLYFLFNDLKGYFDKVYAVMKFLGDEGIGADRSQGKGAFSLNINETSLPSLSDANAFVTLSLYFPLKEELEEYFRGEKILSYSLVERGGFVYSPFSKKAVRKQPKRLFTEGSVFPLLGKEIYGKMVEVRKKDEVVPHDVFLYGYAFPFKLKVESETP